jgi:imidazolonepropionase
VTDLLLTDIGQLVTNDGEPMRNAVVAIDGDKISFVGTAKDAPFLGNGEILQCGGAAVLPGFVDAHTHLIFAGDRSDEFSRRLAGESYSQLAAEGGGILSTVSATRAATEEQLFDLAVDRAWRMIRSGTTTIEVKSGYGLDLETELRLLRVANRLGDTLPITVKVTFLGAHSIPPEFANDRTGYIDLVVETMLPEVALFADYCDVFVEEGAFTVDEARKIFAVATEFGLGARVHAEQLSRFGGARLAAEIGAVSADHLDYATMEDAQALAAAGTSAVLVPGASYTLRSDQAPGQMLIEAGCNIALATDCNPGTSYFEAISPIISLAVVQMGLTVDQAIHAATRGGASSLGLDDRGFIEAGARADMIVLDAPNVAHIPYRPATNLVGTVISGGVVIR